MQVLTSSLLIDNNLLRIFRFIFLTSSIFTVSVVAISPSHAPQASPPNITPRSSHDCAANCSAWVDKFPLYTWVSPQSLAPTTITAATIVTIINTVENTTRTSTIYNDLPSGQTLPPLNENGTRVTTITYTRLGSMTSTILAFPTAFIAWNDGFIWSGTLPTTTSQGSICETAPATDAVVQFSSYPQPAVTMPPDAASADPRGLSYMMSVEDQYIDELRSVYTDQMALQSCSVGSEISTSVMDIQLNTPFMFDSSTSYEEITPTLTSPTISSSSTSVLVVSTTSTTSSSSSTSVPVASTTSTTSSSSSTSVPVASTTTTTSSAPRNLYPQYLRLLYQLFTLV